MGLPLRYVNYSFLSSLLVLIKDPLLRRGGKKLKESVSWCFQSAWLKPINHFNIYHKYGVREKFSIHFPKWVYKMSIVLTSLIKPVQCKLFWFLVFSDVFANSCSWLINNYITVCDSNSLLTRINLGVFVTWLQINYMNYVKLLVQNLPGILFPNKLALIDVILCMTIYYMICLIFCLLLPNLKNPVEEYRP